MIKRIEWVKLSAITPNTCTTCFVGYVNYAQAVKEVNHVNWAKSKLIRFHTTLHVHFDLWAGYYKIAKT